LSDDPLRDGLKFRVRLSDAERHLSLILVCGQRREQMTGRVRERILVEGDSALLLDHAHAVLQPLRQQILIHGLHRRHVLQRRASLGVIHGDREGGGRWGD